MKIRGYNDFYDGWLARIFNEPSDPSKSEAWIEGWRTGDETPSVAAIIAAEVSVGHIIVEAE